MSNDRFPNLMGLFDLVDGLLGCLWGLMKLVLWLILLVFVVSVLGGQGN